jgi:sortase A
VRLARVIGGVGRTFITAGVLILLFVAYQLWGTGIRQAQAQRSLERDFEAVLEAAPPPTTTTTTTTEPGADPPRAEPELAPPIELPPPGEAVARIRIPSIGVDEIVVVGVSLADLRKGPGHFPETPLPGQAGNAAIAGHRTTYGAPFHRIDEIGEGDEIFVETIQGEFRYEYMGTEIVTPDRVDVLDDMGDHRLTLTACHPKYSARQRIVVTAALTGEPLPVPEPAPTAEPRPVATTSSLLDQVDGEGHSSVPAVLHGLLVVGLAVAAWLLGRWWLRWPVYLVATPVLLVALFFFFEAFNRLLPTAY